jgi:membrane protease YdiL (CAAX protease family)
MLAQLAFAALGLVLLVGLRLHRRRIGLGKVDLLRAVLGIAFACGLLLAVLFIVNVFGGEVQVFRQSYPPIAVLDNWLLTGLGEELFFCRPAVQRAARGDGQTCDVAGGALECGFFALWHQPGYVAIALRSGQAGSQALFGLLLNLVSWGFFGAIYLLSENLWLTAFAHASTDYALLPAVASLPVLGLLFMSTVVVFAWRIGRRYRGQHSMARGCDRSNQVRL